MGLNLEPVVPYLPFFTGRAIHYCLEMYYGPDHTPLDRALELYLHDEQEIINKVGELWPSESAAFDEQILMMRGLLEHYKLWVEQDHKMYSDENLEFISLEEEFDVPLRTPSGKITKRMRLGGRFDGIVRHKQTGEYWIWECKTARSVQELVNSLANDEQCGAYSYAAEQMFGYPIKGILYNIMRKKAPTAPAMLQDGSLSKATRVDCTDFYYQSWITQLFPDYSEDTIQMFYGDMLATLREKEPVFFMRYPVYRSKYEIKELMKNIYYTGAEMIRKSTKLYPAPGWLSCNFCHFKSPCLTMNAGSNYEVLLREEFQPRVSASSMRGSDSSTDEI